MATLRSTQMMMDFPRYAAPNLAPLVRCTRRVRPGTRLYSVSTSRHGASSSLLLTLWSHSSPIAMMSNARRRWGIVDGTDEEFLFTHSFLVAVTRAGTGAGGLFTCKCFVLLYPRSFWRLDIHHCYHSCNGRL